MVDHEHDTPPTDTSAAASAAGDFDRAPDPSSTDSPAIGGPGTDATSPPPAAKKTARRRTRAAAAPATGDDPAQPSLEAGGSGAADPSEEAAPAATRARTPRKRAARARSTVATATAGDVGSTDADSTADTAPTVDDAPTSDTTPGAAPDEAPARPVRARSRRRPAQPTLAVPGTGDASSVVPLEDSPDQPTTPGPVTVDVVPDDDVLSDDSRSDDGPSGDAGTEAPVVDVVATPVAAPVVPAPAPTAPPRRAAPVNVGFALLAQTAPVFSDPFAVAPAPMPAAPAPAPAASPAPDTATATTAPEVAATVGPETAPAAPAAAATPPARRYPQIFLPDARDARAPEPERGGAGRGASRGGRDLTPERLLAAVGETRAQRAAEPPVTGAPVFVDPTQSVPAGRRSRSEADLTEDPADETVDRTSGDSGDTGPDAAADGQGRRRRRRGGRRRRGANDRPAEDELDGDHEDPGADVLADGGSDRGDIDSTALATGAATETVVDTAGTDDDAGEAVGGLEVADVLEPTAGTSNRSRRGRGSRSRRGSAAGDEIEDEPATDADPAGRPAAVDGPESDADRPGGGAEADADETGADATGTDTEGDGEGAAGGRRRRRRRRRGEAGDETEAAAPDDPPDTVVRVREPRKARGRREEGASEVTPARGSTRIEAKRQRRRDGRDAQKRPPILTESEFLARREAVARTMLVREKAGRTQIAVLEDGLLVEHYVAEESAPTDRSLIGDVYLGRVQNVLPAMEAAFIDIGRGRNAVLYAGEVDWDGLGMDGKPKRIELALKSGQSVLVQVTKDPIGQKGARLTSQISLAGRYLVLVPNGSMSGISRKLPDTERARLKKILRELVPAKAGVIVRTAAENASEEELGADVARLTGQWDAIRAQAATSSAPAMLQGEPNLAIKVVRDIFNEDFTSLVVAGGAPLEEVRSYIGSVAPSLLDRVEPWTGHGDVFAAHRVDEQLVKALDRKVFLPSGGSLVIDRTEAMTVVDVNTGRFTGSGGNLEETVTENNLEAAEELVRQLRLRDIGGIIVVDFIDMVFEANRDLVIRRLIECLGRDRTRHQVAEVSSLGLVQMTRKRIGRGLLEVFGHTCETCHGRGMVVDLDGHAVHSDPDTTRSTVPSPPRIPNPGNTGRAHLKTMVATLPVLDDGDTADGTGDTADDDPDAVVGLDLAGLADAVAAAGSRADADPGTAAAVEDDPERSPLGTELEDGGDLELDRVADWAERIVDDLDGLPEPDGAGSTDVELPGVDVPGDEVPEVEVLVLETPDLEVLAIEVSAVEVPEGAADAGSPGDAVEAVDGAVGDELPETADDGLESARS